jgi:HD-like signal output (HDOD) protein/DNA-binding CsgD family transcriptional regulator
MPTTSRIDPQHSQQVALPGGRRGPQGSRAARSASPSVRRRSHTQPAGSHPEASSCATPLSVALAAATTFPALAESHARLLAALERQYVVSADVVATIESDVALTIAVLREANAVRQGRTRFDSVVRAVAALSPERIHELASDVPTFGFFERAGAWGRMPEDFRLHALATQRFAGRIAYRVGFEGIDRLAVSSLLHDIGRIALVRAYPSYPSRARDDAATPQARIRLERRMLGFDHCVIGGLLIRRWGLPPSLAVTIERHHDLAAGVEAAIVGLADMLAHYERGAPADPREMLASARAIGLGPKQLRELLCEVPSASTGREVAVDPCPLSAQELKVLKLLAEGRVYKEIASELRLSVSTIRSHLHGVYVKLDVLDRAQAVIFATKRGWIESA